MGSVVRKQTGAIWHPTRMLIGKPIAEPSVRHEYRCPYCNYINVRYERKKTGLNVLCSNVSRGVGSGIVSKTRRARRARWRLRSRKKI